MVLKKLFSCYVLLLFLICCDSDHTKENKKINGFALGTSYSISYADLSLNENILEYGWKIKSSEMINRSEGLPVEIYTLSHRNYILKCVIIYRGGSFSKYCELP